VNQIKYYLSKKIPGDKIKPKLENKIILIQSTPSRKVVPNKG
jgi:hypothetical protein